MLPGLSSAQQITRCLDLSSENVGWGGGFISVMGDAFWNHQSLRSQPMCFCPCRLSCRFGASVLCVFAAQNSVTWKNQLKDHNMVPNETSPSFPNTHPSQHFVSWRLKVTSESDITGTLEWRGNSQAISVLWKSIWQFFSAQVDHGSAVGGMMLAQLLKLTSYFPV